MKSEALSLMFEKDSMAFYFILSYLESLELRLIWPLLQMTVLAVSPIFDSGSSPSVFSHSCPCKEESAPSGVCFFCLTLNVLWEGTFHISTSPLLPP